MTEPDVVLLLGVLAVVAMSLCISMQERRIKTLRRALDSSYLQYDAACEDAHAFACKAVELQNDLDAARMTFEGITACSTCEVCRGAARIALERFSNTPQRG